MAICLSPDNHQGVSRNDRLYVLHENYNRKIDLYRNAMYNPEAVLEYTLVKGNAGLRTRFPW